MTADNQTRQERQRQKITKRVVDAMASGTTIWDTDLTGFGVRRQVRDPSFILKYSFNGKQRFHTIGQHGPLTVDQARTEAKRLIGLIASGVDPKAAPAEKIEAITVKTLCERYLLEGPSFKPDKRASSWSTDQSNIIRHIIPLLGEHLAGEVRESHIIRFIAAVTRGETKADEKTGYRGRAIVDGGKGTAARSLAVLSAAYTYGIRAGLLSENPTKTVKPPKGEAPGRFLSPDEWTRLGQTLSNLEKAGRYKPFLDAIRLLALTGCRRSEITNLKWEEVDLQRGVLNLKTSKVGARSVPVSDQAIALLGEIPRSNLFVFPSSRGTGPIIGIQKVWGEIRDIAELGQIRLHDLRHSFASQAVNAGASLYMTGALLGHRQSKTTQRYAHLQADPLRAVATEAARGIDLALKSE